MAYLFCNVGWMKYYRGQDANDKIFGGGSYVDREGHGFEVCNFAPYKNQIYGYVQPRGSTININKLGAVNNDALIKNVNVIWTAKHPGGGTCIIGWYINATVHRKYKKFGQAPPCHQANNVDGYRIVVEESNCTLLPIEQRTVQIPKMIKGGMGQSNIWYADKPESEKYETKY